MLSFLAAAFGFWEAFFTTIDGVFDGGCWWSEEFVTVGEASESCESCLPTEKPRNFRDEEFEFCLLREDSS
ncbi:hypothetical protein QG37_00784 [Candidozyma auris]|nr:hypothetical protein QG37_00784 [[Candida] auris]